MQNISCARNVFQYKQKKKNNTLLFFYRLTLSGFKQPLRRWQKHIVCHSFYCGQVNCIKSILLLPTLSPENKMKSACARCSLDILPLQRAGTSTALRAKSDSPWRVPASTGGLTAPSLHRQARPALSLKYYERRLCQRSLYTHMPDTRTDFVTASSLSLYDHSKHIFNSYSLWGYCQRLTTPPKLVVSNLVTKVFLADYFIVIAQTLLRGITTKVLC